MTQYIFLVYLVSSIILSCCPYATAGNDSRAGTNNTSTGGRIGYVGVLLDGNQVMGVIAGSPAAKAHLMKGDLIVSVNNYQIKASKGDEAEKAVRGIVGTSVALVVQRGGKNYSCTLVRSEALVQSGLAPSFAGTSAAPKESSASSPDADPALNSSVKPDKIDLEMISIFRTSADSAPAYNRVIQALHHIPSTRRDDLSKWGLKIVIAPTIVDAHPQFATEKPRGYLHGGTYQNCPGLFMPNTKTIYVAEKASMGNNPFQQNVWIFSTVLHEFGHALDAMEYRSKSADFTKAYTEDSQRLTNELRNTFYYFTQSDEAGPSELFAELFSIASGGSGYAPGMDSAFPRSFKYVKQIESP
jgi:hypothetical protein